MNGVRTGIRITTYHCTTMQDTLQITIQLLAPPTHTLYLNMFLHTLHIHTLY